MAKGEEPPFQFLPGGSATMYCLALILEMAVGFALSFSLGLGSTNPGPLNIPGPPVRCMLLTAPQRRQIREQFDLQGSVCGPECAHFWCGPCALAQDLRELKYRVDAAESAPLQNEMERSHKNYSSLGPVREV